MPPVLGAISSVQLTAGEATAVELSVVDPDSSAEELEWYIDGQPGFVSLQVDSNGDASLQITPELEDVGAYSDIHVWVSDGVFMD